MGTRLAGKVAIVTGAGKGIGKGIARVFAAEGARVAVVNRSEAGGRQTAEEIISAGGTAEFLQADVSCWTDMARMAKTVLDRWRRIDILCQNAGIYPGKNLTEMGVEAWDEVLNVNLRGTFLAVKACLPAMIAQRYGRIVITSSITGPRTAIPGHVHYAASKAGINGFIRGAALELAAHNITVNGIEPGNILTEGLQELGDKHLAGMAASIPMGRLGKPEDVAYAMLFLASDEAEWVTGQTLVVDGGQVLPESQFDLA